MWMWIVVHSLDIALTLFIFCIVSFTYVFKDEILNLYKKLKKKFEEKFNNDSDKTN
jgi:hypothetical protein